MNIFPQRWLRTGSITLGALVLLMGGQSVAAESKDVVISKAGPPEFRFDFAILGGAHWFYPKHSLGSYPHVDTDPPTGTDWVGISPRTSGVFGGRLGLHFNRWLGVEAEVGITPTRTRNDQSAMWVFGYRGNLILNLTDSHVFQPFILAGMGALTSLVDKPEVVGNDTWAFMHAGVGFKIGFTPWTGLRADGRIMGPWTVLGFPKGDRMSAQGPDWEVLGSVYLNFGEIERVNVTVIKESSGDRDGDGIPDNLDKCPNEPEDKDGFQDEDGCPDPDNDGDGIPDVRDKCPNEPETFNNYKDDDGCPDEVPAEVKKFTGVIQGINFKTASAEILAGSYVILDRAVKVLQDYPEVNLEISGHTDNRGKADYNLDLSQRRADSVKTYFVQRGVASARLQAIGYGLTRPIADNKTGSGRATNRRTEFRLINPSEK